MTNVVFNTENKSLNSNNISPMLFMLGARRGLCHPDIEADAI